MPVSVVVAGVFIAGAVMWSNANPTTSPDKGGEPTVVVDINNVATDGNPFIGQADAPVVIAFWSDFQCPFCKAAETGGVPQIPVEPAIPQIDETYIKTGKVKLVFMDFAFLGKDSLDAALYNRAVWKLYPELYYTWRTAMYEAQDEEGDKGFGDAASIDALNATISGLDADAIATDVAENGATYRAMVERDMQEARKVGIDATPSFVIGNQVIAGAYPFSKFQTVIEAELAQ